MEPTALIIGVAAKVGPALLSSAAARVASGVADELKPAFESMQGRLERLERHLEEHRASHLRTAFLFLRDGRLDNAAEELYRAAGEHRVGAVARFWLSVVTHAEGKSEEALGHFAEAMAINPFVVPPELSAFVRPASTNRLPALDWGRPLMPNRLKSAKASEWRRPKTSRGRLSRLTRAVLDSQREGPLSGTQARIFRLSVGGIDPVVDWTAGVAVFTKGKRILSAFELLSGEPKWHFVGAGRRFQFATPRYVVLADDEARGSMSLFELSSGEPVFTASTEYLSAIFAPPYWKELSRYRDSHVTLATSTRTPHATQATAYQRYEDARFAQDPFGWGLNICAANSWSSNVNCDAGLSVRYPVTRDDVRDKKAVERLAQDMRFAGIWGRPERYRRLAGPPA